MQLFAKDHIENWMIWLWLDDDDLLLEWESDVIKKLNRVKIADSYRISYDQKANNKTRSACTLFAPLGVISSIYNKVLTQDEIMDARHYAVKNYWYKEWVGNYAQKWVSCICNRWNQKFPNQRVVFFRTFFGTKDVDLALEKWYGVCGTFNGNADYNDDRRDWTLDWTEYMPTTYGHATSIHMINWTRRCYDSSKSYPTYKVANDPSKIKNWNKPCYVFFPEKDMSPRLMQAIALMRARRALQKM